MKGLFPCLFVMLASGPVGASEPERVMFYKAAPVQSPVIHAVHRRTVTHRAPEPERLLFEQFLEWLRAHPAAKPGADGRFPHIQFPALAAAQKPGRDRAAETFRPSMASNRSASQRDSDAVIVEGSKRPGPLQEFQASAQHTDPVHQCPANSEPLGDLRGAEVPCLEPCNLTRIDARLPPLVDTGGLGLGDPLERPLAPQVRLELGEHAQHVEEALARGRAGVDWLRGRLE